MSPPDCHGVLTDEPVGELWPSSNDRPISARTRRPASSLLSPRHGSDYAELSRIIKRAGLLRRRPVHYTVKGTITLLVFAATWVVFGFLGNTWWQLFTAAFLAVVYTQVSFLGTTPGTSRSSAAAAATTRSGWRWVGWSA